MHHLLLMCRVHNEVRIEFLAPQCSLVQFLKILLCCKIYLRLVYSLTHLFLSLFNSFCNCREVCLLSPLVFEISCPKSVIIWSNSSRARLCQAYYLRNGLRQRSQREFIFLSLQQCKAPLNYFSRDICNYAFILIFTRHHEFCITEK